MTGPHALNNGWIACSHRREAPVVRLFCLPYAGGGASSYRPWSDELDAEIEAAPVQLPGREGRLKEPPFTDMDELIGALLRALGPLMDELPFALFGHSFGAIVAFEIARRRTADGRRPPSHLFVSGRRAPHFPRRREPVHDRPREELEEWLEGMSGTPAAVLRDPDMMSMVLPTLRADLSIEETYSREPEPLLACPLTAIGGRADVGALREELAGWSHFSRGRFDLQMLSGDHFYLFNESRRATLAAISEALLGTEHLLMAAAQRR